MHRPLAIISAFPSEKTGILIAQLLAVVIQIEIMVWLLGYLLVDVDVLTALLMDVFFADDLVHMAVVRVVLLLEGSVKVVNDVEAFNQ